MVARVPEGPLGCTMQAGFARQGLGMIEAYKAAGLEDLFRARLSAMSARVLNLRQGLARRRMRLTALPGLTSLADHQPEIQPERDGRARFDRRREAWADGADRDRRELDERLI